jgi:hypothetical protein
MPSQSLVGTSVFSRNKKWWDYFLLIDIGLKNTLLQKKQKKIINGYFNAWLSSY